LVVPNVIREELILDLIPSFGWPKPGRLILISIFEASWLSLRRALDLRIFK
jgi:hypothetical protein